MSLVLLILLAVLVLGAFGFSAHTWGPSSGYPAYYGYGGLGIGGILVLVLILFLFFRG